MMKTALLSAVALTALLSGARAQQPSASEETAALLKLEQSWADAVARHDAAFIARVEDDAYTYTDAAGNVAHKADDLATARAGDVKIESFKLGDMKVQFHGDAAVVTGETILLGSDRGGSLNGTYRWTDTFVRPAGWQLAGGRQPGHQHRQDGGDACRRHSRRDSCRR